MNQRDEAEKYYQKLKQKGFWKYSFQKGIVWAIPTYILFRLFLIGDASFQDYTLKRTLFDVILWCVMGCLFFGPFMWYSQIFAYKKAMKKFDNEK